MKQLTDYNDNTHSVIAGLQLGVLYEAFPSSHIFGRCHRFGRFNLLLHKQNVLSM